MKDDVVLGYFWRVSPSFVIMAYCVAFVKQFSKEMM